MGLMDLFKKKDVMEKIKEYAEAENTGKLVKLSEIGNKMEVRLAAIAALSEIKMDELCVDTLMSLLNEEDRDIKLAACNSLKRVGTKREVDVLRHKAETEEDEEVARAMENAATAARERTPRF